VNMQGNPNGKPLSAAKLQFLRESLSPPSPEAAEFVLAAPPTRVPNDTDLREATLPDEDEPTIARLVQAAKGRTARKRDVVAWAFDHVPVAWGEIDADSVPSVGAIGLLQSAKAEPTKFHLEWAKPRPSDPNEEPGDSDGLKASDKSILDIIGELKHANQNAAERLVLQDADDE